MKCAFKCLSMILCVLLTAVGLSGCHGSVQTTGFKVPDSFDTSRNYTITFWAKNDTNKAQTKIYEQAISDFEALYPNITVQLKLYNDYGVIYNDVITNIQTDTTPNVCITYPDHIATYLQGNNVVVPLDDLITNERYGLGGTDLAYDGPDVGEVVPEYLEECKLNGSYYALPYMRSTEVCYVNKTYVEALGYELPETLTWDFMFEVADAAMAKNPDGSYVLNGQNVLIPVIYKSTDNMMIQMLKQLDAPYSTDSGDIEIFNDSTREILKNVAAHAKDGTFSTFKIAGYPANFLNAGQCIFAIDSSAGSTWMGSDAPLVDISEDKLVRFETAVMTVPQFDPQNKKMISQGPSVCIFNKSDPQEVLASWLFMQYLLTDDVQIGYSETEGYIPVTSKAQNNAEYVDYLSRAGEDNSTHYSVKLQAVQLLLDNIENTFTTPVFNGSASLRDAAGAMIENVVKSTRRKKIVDDAFIDELFTDMVSLYRLDQVSSGGAGKAELGPMPASSRALLITLACVWVLIGAYALFNAVRRRGNK